MTARSDMRPERRKAMRVALKTKTPRRNRGAIFYEDNYTRFLSFVKGIFHSTINSREINRFSCSLKSASAVSRSTRSKRISSRGRSCPRL